MTPLFKITFRVFFFEIIPENMFGVVGGEGSERVTEQMHYIARYVKIPILLLIFPMFPRF